MPAIPWLPGIASETTVEIRPPRAGLIVPAPLVVDRARSSLPSLKAGARSRAAGLRLLPAASVLLWWELPPARDAGGAPTEAREPVGAPSPETAPDLRDRLLAALQPPLGLFLSAAGVVEWPHDLMPFQVQGVRLLFERDRLLLADEMGLGKTIQALAALRLLALRSDVASCLIVTPAAVLAQWRDQFARWAPELRLSPVRGSLAARDAQWRTPAHAHLVSYETLRADAALATSRTWDLVIIDEAQRIKTADAGIALAVKRLRRRRAWALTGTPLENRVEDLASILEFVRPRLGDDAPAPVRPTSSLRSVLSEVQLRRRKADVLAELPPKVVSELLLPMTPQQRAAYERAEHEGLVQLRTLGPAVRVANVLELIVRLKQLCNFDPVSGASAKMGDLEDRLRLLRESGERALVFTQFTDDVYGAHAIARRLSAHDPLVLTGQHSLAQREQTIQRFRADPGRRLLILSLRAGGVGLNLQEASYVFHFDRWWNPAVEDQASDRSHRLGQTRPVNVYAYSLEDSVEERILDVLREKRLLFEEIVEGSGIQLQTALTREELLRVAGLPGYGAGG
jgi:SNF2 family DNA or RNA helicase